MRYADQPVHEFVSGHAPQGAPSTDDHLAIVPLPFVGSQWADGRIVGLGIVLPDGTADRDRDALFRAIAAWEDDSRRDDEDTPLLPILLGAAGVLSVIRVEGEARERALSPSTWCRESRRWASATPVMLDHNPGDLRSRDPEKLRKIQAEARASIRRACERIGLPPPETVIVQRAAPLAGGEKVRAFAAVADRSGPVRILTHAVIEFATPVRGPILIGAGRYHGLGLMRPVVDHE